MLIRPCRLAEIATLSAILLMGSVILVPTTQEGRASSHFVPHAPIVIANDSEFTGENGVSGGSGTADDPYVITGWEISKSTGEVTVGGIAILDTKAHVIIRDVYIHSLPTSSGIFLDGVSNATIEGAIVWDARWGIAISDAHSITIRESDISSTEVHGISIASSARVTVRGNLFISSGITILGIDPSHFDTHNITKDNLVNGRPVFYYKDCSDLDVDGEVIGQLIVSSCTNVQVANLQIRDTDIGILLAYVDQAQVLGTDVSNNEFGIRLYQASNATISGNDAFGNVFGVSVSVSSTTPVARNNLSRNEYGLQVTHSNRVRVFHNNFVNNTIHAIDDRGEENSWDGGYPEGGNYWSGYAGADMCSGPGQDSCVAPDGIGDTPYSLRSAVDRFPLMEPYDRAISSSPSISPG